MRNQLFILALILFESTFSLRAAASEPVRVTVDNFCRAESDTYFRKFVTEESLASSAMSVNSRQSTNKRSFT